MHDGRQTAPSSMRAWAASSEWVLFRLAVGAWGIDTAWEAFNCLRASCGLLPPRAVLGGCIVATPTRRSAAASVAPTSSPPPYPTTGQISTTTPSRGSPFPLPRANPGVFHSGDQAHAGDQHAPASLLFSAAFSRPVKTPMGSYVAIDMLIDLCDIFLRRTVCSKRQKLTKPARPSTLVLHSCVQFGSPLNAHQMLEIMIHGLHRPHPSIIFFIHSHINIF